MLKQKFLKIRKARFFKIVIGGLSLVSLLTLSAFVSLPSAADRQSQESAPPEEIPNSESLLNNSVITDAVPSGSSTVYLKSDKVVKAGKLLSFTIAADDPDGDTLFYSAANLPDGSAFDADTQTFTWTPRYDQAGIYSVRFEVTDGEFTDSEDITITVLQLYDDWDVNGDGASNILDMVLVGQRWGQSGLSGWVLEDTNEDGNIDVLDLIIIAQHWTG
jgi:hypothetical protein